MSENNLKYANMTFNARGVNNLGDNIQLIALDAIYKNEFHLSTDDIVYINKNDLDKYDGERVILPISLAMIDYVNWNERFSDKIIPLFLGLSIEKDFLNPEDVTFFKKHEPIGCRDERTYHTMQSYGIESYLGGCITLTLPERSEKHGDKIFCVDCKDRVIESLPDFLKKDAVFTTQMVKNTGVSPKELMEKQYSMYKDQAKLVISPLLHCTFPCIAAGIPIICVKDVLSYRFSWIDKILKIYRSDEVSEITEIPSPIDVSYAKTTLTDLTVKRLRDPKKVFPEMEALTAYWLDRKRNDYVIEPFLPYSTFIEKKSDGSRKSLPLQHLGIDSNV